MSKGRNVEIASFRRSLSKDLRNAGLKPIIFDDCIQQIQV